MLAKEPGRIPNLGWLADRAAFFEFGSTVNFPSITWPSHSAILTGAWSGHHDIVGPTYYVRETRTVVPAQGQVFDTAQFLGDEVETLYEAFKRVFGQDTLTISIHEPQSRGADHAAWERRVLGERTRLKALTNELMDVNPRWKTDDKLAVEREEIVDVRGLAQLLTILEEPTMVPRFVAHELVVTDGAGHDYGPHHEAVREALSASDRRIGIVFDALKRRGLFDSTLFVVTADHGMAAQNVALRANPTCAPRDQNIKGVYAEPMIYLRDMAIDVIRARDGRTVRVEVRDNDADAGGTHPPVASASVTARDKNGNVLGDARTDQHGLCAIATPANLGDDQIVIEIEHTDFNHRHFRADGTRVAADLRIAMFPY